MVGFLCTACGKSFTQKVALRKHFYAIHIHRFLEAGGNISQVKNFKSCSFKPMKLTNGKDDTPVLVQYPPDPLHVVYLGPANDLLSNWNKNTLKQWMNFILRTK